MSFRHVFETPFGFCAIAWNDRGICRFILPMDSPSAIEKQIARRLPASSPALPSGPAAQAVASARRYFAGEREDFSAFAVDLEGVEPFSTAIYHAARTLGYGETTTYGGLAEKAGFPRAARETGTALGLNPVPLIIPCHRILAAGGKLGGFSAPGGAKTKRKMLMLEGAVPPNAEPAQGTFGF